MTPFRIVVPVWNAERWIGACLRSIRAQRYEDWRCLVLDDRSTDRTLERALEAAAGEPRMVVERAPERRFALGNIVAGVRQVSTSPWDVLAVVDGDDRLSHRDVLSTLDRVYASGDVWLTYGNHRRVRRWVERVGLRRHRGIKRPIPDEVARDRLYRYWDFVAGHLRTYRRFLWDAIQDADLRDDDGRYYLTAWDVAFMTPMLEMAGPEHVRYVHDVLYVYNAGNPQNDHTARKVLQKVTAYRIRTRPRYPPLAAPPPRPMGA